VARDDRGDTHARVQQNRFWVKISSEALLVEETLGTEPFGYLVTPFDARELHVTIQAALYKHRMECALQDANVHLEEADRQRTVEFKQGEAHLRALNETLERLVTERTGELRKSEQRYRYWMLTMPGAVYEFCVDAAGHRSLPFISNGLADLTGLSPADAMADVEVVFQRIPLDARSAMNESMRHSLATLSPWLHEFPIRTTPGDVKWLRGHAVPRREQDGGTCWTGVLVDITERKLAEEALASSKQQLQDILDSLFGFVALYTLDGRIVEINRAPLELGGVAKADVLDRYFWETPWWSGLPDMQSRLQDWMSRAAQGELVRGELVFRVSGGHMATAEAIFGPLRNAVGVIMNVIGFGVDITERKQANEALRSSEFRLNEAQRIAQIGSWELDLRTNNLTWSDETYRIFEIDPADFQSSYEGFLNLVHPDDREMVSRAYSDSVASRTPYDITHRMLMKDGRIKFVQERCQTDYLPDGTPIRSLGTVQDITERKQTEDALQFLSTGITDLSGEAFFSEMAVQAAKLLGLEIGFVGKLLATQPLRIRAVGLSIDGQALPPVEYDLAQTPCERVIGKQTAIFPEQVQQLFPDDQMLADLGISSYAAIPLFDMSGRPIGHVGVMSRRPLRQVKQVEDLLRLFAVRAAAELERQRAERKFHDLFEFSSDAIILVNQEGLVMLANRQAELLFGHSRAEFLGLSVEMLMPESEQHRPAGLRACGRSSSLPPR